MFHYQVDQWTKPVIWLRSSNVMISLECVLGGGGDSKPDTACFTPMSPFMKEPGSDYLQGFLEGHWPLSS